MFSNGIKAAYVGGGTRCKVCSQCQRKRRLVVDSHIVGRPPPSEGRPNGFFAIDSGFQPRSARSPFALNRAWICSIFPTLAALINQPAGQSPANPPPGCKETTMAHPRKLLEDIQGTMFEYLHQDEAEFLYEVRGGVLQCL